MLETDNVNNSNDDMVNRVSLGSTLMSPRQKSATIEKSGDDQTY